MTLKRVTNTKGGYDKSFRPAVILYSGNAGSCAERDQKKVIKTLTEYGEYTPENIDLAMSFQIYDLEDLIDIREYVGRMEVKQRKNVEQKGRRGRW